MVVLYYYSITSLVLYYCITNWYYGYYHRCYCHHYLTSLANKTIVLWNVDNKKIENIQCRINAKMRKLAISLF